MLLTCGEEFRLAKRLFVGAGAAVGPDGQLSMDLACLVERCRCSINRVGIERGAYELVVCDGDGDVGLRVAVSESLQAMSPMVPWRIWRGAVGHVANSPGRLGGVAAA
jgi:hypothetical protein